MKLLVITLCCCVLSTVTALAVKINELRIDQPSDDNDEYLELFGTPGESLDGVSYVILGDGSAGTGEVELALDLTGQMVGATGFFLVAEDADTFGSAADLELSINLENSDNVTHLLVSGFAGTTSDDLDMNDDGVLETLPWTGIVDGVALIEDAAVPPTGTEYHYAGQLALPVVGPDGSAVPGHVYRLPDGGAFQIGPFDPVDGLDTPGSANIPEPAGIVLLGLACVAGIAILRAAKRTAWTPEYSHA
jgi:hypothetical protein